MPALNLPIVEQLAPCQNILLAGMGGGYDVFAALPLYLRLRDLGKTVHLANYNSLDISGAPSAEGLEILLGGALLALWPAPQPLAYSPEHCLANYLAAHLQIQAPVYVIHASGLQAAQEAYAHLAQKLKLEAIILVDGGVDSLMRGDEESPGTLLEDAISLAAIANLDLPLKIVACLGLGTEKADGLSHYHALENMAALIAKGAFLGACALSAQQTEGQIYQAALAYASTQARQTRSHIQNQIQAAMGGHFGPLGERFFISPLMLIYWFFSAPEVIENSLLIPQLSNTRTLDEALSVYLKSKQEYPAREYRAFPL